DRGHHPRAAQARALQGNGNPLPGRARPQEGRQDGGGRERRRWRRSQEVGALSMKDKWTRYEYRKGRSRRKIAEKANGRPRLTVHRSLKYIYAQIVDDAQGKTLAAASS